VSFRDGDVLMFAIVDARAEGVCAKAYPLMDQTKRMGHVAFNKVTVNHKNILCMGAVAEQAYERLLDQGALAMTAEMSGATEAALHITVQYAKDRTQFGHPIGHFQAVKHPLAEVYVDLESF